MTKPLTDEIVVRRIAEFMGWTRLHLECSEKSMSPPIVDCAWYGQPNEGCSRRCRCPDYLGDYNAIAEVWRKLCNTKTPEDRALLREATVGVMVALKKRDTVLYPCAETFLIPPRDHAYAIADALGENPEVLIADCASETSDPAANDPDGPGEAILRTPASGD